HLLLPTISLLATEDGYGAQSDPGDFKTVAHAREVWNFLDSYRYLVTPTIDSNLRTGWQEGSSGMSIDLKIDSVVSRSSANNDPPLTLVMFNLRADLLDYLSKQASESARAALRRIRADDSSRCYYYGHLTMSEPFLDAPTETAAPQETKIDAEQHYILP